MFRVSSVLPILLTLVTSPWHAGAEDLPGCASALHEWLQARAEVLGNAVSAIDERQYPADAGAVTGIPSRLVNYRFDAQGDLALMTATAGRLRSRSLSRADGRRIGVDEQDESGRERHFAYSYGAQGYHYLETESENARGQDQRVRARFWLVRIAAPAAGQRAGAAAPFPLPDLHVSPGIAAPQGFRDACLAQIIDREEGSSTYSLKYVQYDARGLDVFSASAAYPSARLKSGDDHAIFALLDGIATRGGVDEDLQPLYSQTRVSGFDSPFCRGTSLLTVVGSSRRDLQFRAGALDGYWVVLDAAGRVCTSRFGNRTEHYGYDLDALGNWTGKQELVREDGSGLDYRPGDRQERTLSYRAALQAQAEGTLTDAAADSEHQAEVARRGTEVMPFALPRTVHVFTPTDDGGLQQVRLRTPQDGDQLPLIRSHLQEIRQQFLRGDFSAPGHIHGEDMPGLATLRAAAPGSLAIDYQELEDGAQLRYHSAKPELVTALHQWFAAQLADHGHDAMAGHAHHHPTPPGE